MYFSASYAIDHLLMRTEKQAFLALDEGSLKSRLVVLLSQGDDCFEFAQKAISIIAQTEKTTSRDKFLLHLLQKVAPETQKSLEKVIQFVGQGVFQNFLKIMDPPQKIYFSHPEIVKSIQLFEESLSQPSTCSIIRSTSQDLGTSCFLDVYEQLENCRYYYQLPKLIEMLAITLSEQTVAKEFLKGKFDFLFYLLNRQYGKQFDHHEKLALAKIVIRLIKASFCGEMAHYSEMELADFLAQACELKTKVGEEILRYCTLAIKQHLPISLDEMARGLQLLSYASKAEAFYTLMSRWKETKFAWNSLFEILEVFLTENPIDETFFQEDISERLKRFSQDSTVTKPLDNSDLDILKGQYEKMNDFCRQYCQLSFHQLMTKAHEIRKKAWKKPIPEEKRLELIAIGRLAIRLQFGIFPYSTQILALLGILLRGESWQAQVKTGEGKSTIIALYAFVMAMECRAVDIITSARYLAKRDQEKFALFFKRCDITTSHICYDSKKSDHFRAQILYAPAFDFEFAWMGDRLWGTNLYDERLKTPYVRRNFDCVCVDESDNLLIDTAANSARLAFPARLSYEWIYSPILSFVKSCFTSRTSSWELTQSISRLRAFIHAQVNVENQLISQEISDKQFEIWLQSAFHVLFELKEHIDYVIKPQKNDEGKTEGYAVLIADLKTGRISENSRWSNGIHEFIEVKHNITVQKESLTPISLSHAIFYGFYQTITALTGTAEHFQTERIYKIQTFHVPPHLPLKRKDLPPIYATDTDSYRQAILSSIQDCIQSKRPILILCETILDSIRLAEFLKRQSISYQILNEVQEAEEHMIISQAGVSGQITVATNTAGRGTDIILDKESLANGGLHVLLTFFPSSEREELQAIGRAGRQGQPGSSQMILNLDSPSIKKLLLGALLSGCNNLEVSLKSQRSELEKRQAERHFMRGNLERETAILSHTFFEAFRLWLRQVSHDSFLDLQSQVLCKISLSARKKNELSFSHLVSPELELAEECKRLLTERADPVSWKIFLKAIIEKVKEEVITDWSLEFFHLAEQKLTALQGTEDEIKEEIQRIFEQNRQKWLPYLKPDGSGILLYIEKLTTISLSFK